MKKTIFATLAAALVLASCAKVEVTEVPDSRAIGFDNFVTNAVKSIDDATLKSFFVYGGWGNNSDEGLVFENQEVTYTALNQECSYTPVKYWVEQIYRFAAYTDNNAALENDNLSFDAALGHMTILNYVADGSADNAEQDLLYAVAQENTNGYNGAEYVAGTATDPVKFDFKHILSQVTFKFTKDAEMELDSDLRNGVMQKIAKGVKSRKKGEPIRLVYDAAMPRNMLRSIARMLHIDKWDTQVAGGRYHNMKDLMRFPDCGLSSLRYGKREPILKPEFASPGSMLESIRIKDRFLHYPYHSFSSFLRVLREAAISPDVTEIKMTMYL